MADLDKAMLANISASHEQNQSQSEILGEWDKLIGDAEEVGKDMDKEIGKA